MKLAVTYVIELGDLTGVPISMHEAVAKAQTCFDGTGEVTHAAVSVGPDDGGRTGRGLEELLDGSYL